MSWLYIRSFKECLDSKQTYACWSAHGPPKIHFALLHPCDKDSFIQFCYFLCLNVTCKIYIGLCEATLLCEKWFCKKSEEGGFQEITISYKQTVGL